MAGRGPLPQVHRQRERDTQRRQTGSTVVARDGKAHGPTILKATGRNDWPVEVTAWWDDWRRMPQARLFEVTDWRRLAQLAALVGAYHRRPTASAMSEIRLNEERLGALYVDRLRAKIYIADTGSQLAPVTALHPSAKTTARDRLHASRARADRTGGDAIDDAEAQVLDRTLAPTATPPF